MLESMYNTSGEVLRMEFFFCLRRISIRYIGPKFGKTKSCYRLWTLTTKIGWCFWEQLLFLYGRKWSSSFLDSWLQCTQITRHCYLWSNKEIYWRGFTYLGDSRPYFKKIVSFLIPFLWPQMPLKKLYMTIYRLSNGFV